MCNVIVDVNDDGSVVLCNADIGPSASYRAAHMCQKHAKGRVILTDQTGSDGVGVFKRWCNKCKALIRLLKFEGLGNVCARHKGDDRACDGRIPVAARPSAQQSAAVGACAPTLGSICVDDRGRVDVSSKTECDVRGCTKSVMTMEGLCHKHSKVWSQSVTTCMDAHVWSHISQRMCCLLIRMYVCKKAYTKSVRTSINRNVSVMVDAW